MKNDENETESFDEGNDSKTKSLIKTTPAIANEGDNMPVNSTEISGHIEDNADDLKESITEPDEKEETEQTPSTKPNIEAVVDSSKLESNEIENKLSSMVTPTKAEEPDELQMIYKGLTDPEFSKQKVTRAVTETTEDLMGVLADDETDIQLPSTDAKSNFDVKADIQLSSTNEESDSDIKESIDLKTPVIVLQKLDEKMIELSCKSSLDNIPALRNRSVQSDNAKRASARLSDNDIKQILQTEKKILDENTKSSNIVPTNKANVGRGRPKKSLNEVKPNKPPVDIKPAKVDTPIATFGMQTRKRQLKFLPDGSLVTPRKYFMDSPEKSRKEEIQSGSSESDSEDSMIGSASPPKRGRYAKQSRDLQYEPKFKRFEEDKKITSTATKSHRKEFDFEAYYNEKTKTGTEQSSGKDSKLIARKSTPIDPAQLLSQIMNTTITRSQLQTHTFYPKVLEASQTGIKSIIKIPNQMPKKEVYGLNKLNLNKPIVKFNETPVSIKSNTKPVPQIEKRITPQIERKPVPQIDKKPIPQSEKKFGSVLLTNKKVPGSFQNGGIISAKSKVKQLLDSKNKQKSIIHKVMHVTYKDGGGIVPSVYVKNVDFGKNGKNIHKNINAIKPIPILPKNMEALIADMNSDNKQEETKTSKLSAKLSPIKKECTPEKSEVTAESEDKSNTKKMASPSISPKMTLDQKLNDGESQNINENVSENDDQTKIDTNEATPSSPPPPKSIFSLMEEISIQMPTWNLHIMPDTNSFCIAQIARGRMGMPVLQKSIELDDELFAKVYVHQFHCKRYDGVYADEASITGLIKEIDTLTSSS